MNLFALLFFLVIIGLIILAWMYFKKINNLSDKIDNLIAEHKRGKIVIPSPPTSEIKSDTYNVLDNKRDVLDNKRDVLDNKRDTLKDNKSDILDKQYKDKKLTARFYFSNNCPGCLKFKPVWKSAEKYFQNDPKIKFESFDMTNPSDSEEIVKRTKLTTGESITSYPFVTINRDGDEVEEPADQSIISTDINKIVNFLKSRI
jgi:hypothetical protein